MLEKQMRPGKKVQTYWFSAALLSSSEVRGLWRSNGTPCYKPQHLNISTKTQIRVNLICHIW